MREVDIVTGCLLLAPRTLWEELGGFDTRFFMYGEDADLSLRAEALGYRPAITPDAVVTHEIGVSLGRARGQADAPLPREGDAPAQALAAACGSGSGSAFSERGVGLRSLLSRARGAGRRLDAGLAEPLRTGSPGYPEPRVGRPPRRAGQGDRRCP